MKKSSKGWSVWVGGTEVNDYYLNYEKASELYIKYIDNGYTDVMIRWELIKNDVYVLQR